MCSRFLLRRRGNPFETAARVGGMTENIITKMYTVYKIWWTPSLFVDIGSRVCYF